MLELWMVAHQPCTKEYMSACLNLADFYFEDRRRGVQNDAYAYEYFKKACDGGTDWGCHFAAMLQLQGRLKPHSDPDEEKRIQEKAKSKLGQYCRQNRLFFDEPCAYLYKTYRKNQMKPKHVEITCEHENPDSQPQCAMLGLFYSSVLIPEAQDRRFGKELLAIGCKAQGWACLELSHLHREDGELERADRFLNEACEQRLAQGCRELDARESAQMIERRDDQRVGDETVVEEPVESGERSE